MERSSSAALLEAPGILLLGSNEPVASERLAFLLDNAKFAAAAAAAAAAGVAAAAAAAAAPIENEPSG